MMLKAPLLDFNTQGDIEIRQSNRYGPTVRHFLHQIGLILIILFYLIFGGFFFEFIESRFAFEQDKEIRKIIIEMHKDFNQVVDELFNDELNENFPMIYQQWRWSQSNNLSYVILNNNRTRIFHERIDEELKEYSRRIAIHQLHSDRHVYKWTYSTAVLYAATLVTTIGYGNIAPKTEAGKVITVLYALIGILLVVSWLKSVGESLAKFFVFYYNRIEKYFSDDSQHSEQNINRNGRVPIWLPIMFLFLYLIGGSFLFSAWEGWSYIDGAYFSFITFTTIGFGDFVPGESTLDHRNGRSLLCTSYLLFGVMLTAVSFELLQVDIDRVKSRFLQRIGIEKQHLPRIR